MIRAVLFDMDGTLLDTLEDLKQALNHALACNGLPERTLSETRRFIGNGIRRLVEQGVPAGTPDDVVEKALCAFKDYYRVHCADNTRPYPGVAETVRGLHAEGYRTAVVSNKDDMQVRALAQRFFPDCMDASSGIVQDVRRKPVPDMLERVIAQLGVRKEECVYVGDSEVDLQTALNAGVELISVSWGFRSRAFLEAQGATRIIDRPEELQGSIM